MKAIKEAIILAGGLGTRLRDTVPDVPKCMAPVAGRPFLFYVINYLRLQGVEEIIFSLGYKHELITDYLAEQFPSLRYKCSIEAQPLGTGGAIALACKQATEKNVLIANGDTLFDVDITELAAMHSRNNAECTLALKPMKNFERYGVVETNATGVITRFMEKKSYAEGDINGGVYLLDRELFLSEPWPEIFSFEKDYLEKKQSGLFGIRQDGYFIDIGIPEDYTRAQTEFKKPVLDLKKIDKEWTLFLDRDGVINVDKDGSYIFTPEEFKFLPGAPDLFRNLTEKFGRIIVITNQRGVGRGLMTVNDLEAIHQKMKDKVSEAGGRIDGIYYCTATTNDDPLRKPNPGMAVLAKSDFPGIDFSRSIMVGNNISDMKFGRNAGIYTVFVKTTQPQMGLPNAEIDLSFADLEAFSKALNH